MWVARDQKALAYTQKLKSGYDCKIAQRDVLFKPIYVLFMTFFADCIASSTVMDAGFMI